MSDPAPSPTAPLALDAVCSILSNPHRWRILRELAGGEPLPIHEIGRRLGISRSLASGNLTLLRKAGVLTTGFGHLYTIAPAYRPAPGTLTIALGPCTLHLEKL